MHTNYDGFDLHAAQLVAADDREGLERALRYCARPPLSEQLLSILPDGRVKLALKKKWSDGTTDIIFKPEEFLERLAVLIPRPDKNLLIIARRVRAQPQTALPRRSVRPAVPVALHIE